ncbi:MAG: ABC transporter ATP-binding protein [Nanobdellota archaeon]
MKAGFEGKFTYETIEPLQNINLKIGEGEVIGLIGKNGSGKTTLLKVIAGIIKPTRGTVETKGKIAPFLSLGVGFHDELTAKENMFLYGAILGFTRKQMRKKASKIFRFANVEEFADLKLKNYSSGMIARLAFAIMVESNPDILLLDEIFAVGDKDFRPKCREVFDEYRKKGKTIILASHSLGSIKEFCDKTIWIDKGIIRAFGDNDEIIKQYEDS